MIFAGDKPSSTSMLSVHRMCALTGVSRCGYYRYRHVRSNAQPLPRTVARQETERVIAEVCDRLPSYGYRRVHHELLRSGMRKSPKTVLQTMQRLDLLCTPKRKYITTTDSDHPHRCFRNLMAGKNPGWISRPNQVWFADITFVPFFGFPRKVAFSDYSWIYLAIILDGFSRKVVGWAIDARIGAQLIEKALTNAVASRTVPPGELIHHSDRGVQYASRRYTQILQQQQIRISMSRKGNPYDNAMCESFMKTIKQEEIHHSQYESLPQAQRQLHRYITFYNTQRLHSSLGYTTPDEAENLFQHASQLQKS
jgi:putative transposase